MKTTRCISRITAISVLAVSGVAVAEVGMRDGEDFFRDFKSLKSRAEVRAELEPARAPSTMTSSGGSGVMGVSGSRYTGKSRDEVREELIQHRKTYEPNSPKDIYFGG
ncbi:DUF4148 domain-containing protein [Noviherbaspirillum sp. ST9]|uniref:DUF4148 domain-containing protein n=1 Tax=Noviherbaspirillum sp. ST9 TaxID=3401606 RepID=UPI003B587EA5